MSKDRLLPKLALATIISASAVNDAPKPTHAESLINEPTKNYTLVIPNLTSNHIIQPESDALIPYGCPVVISGALGVDGCKVSYCESGWDPNAIGGQGELGYFQIHPDFHEDATLDPAGNVAAAARISNDGKNWDAWSVSEVLTNGGLCPNDRGYVPGYEPKAS